MGALATWFYIGFVPQFTVWIMFTTVIGSLVGGIAAIAMRVEVAEVHVGLSRMLLVAVR